MLRSVSSLASRARDGDWSDAEGNGPSGDSEDEWIRTTDIDLDSRHASLKTGKDASLGAVARNEVKYVDRPALTDPVDPADALLQAHGIPWQLEVDDETARALKIQSFRGGIGCEEKARAASRELVDGGRAFVATHSAMQRQTRKAERRSHVLQRVPVFGEDNRRLADALEQAREGVDLRFVPRGPGSHIEHRPQKPALVGGIVQGEKRRPGRRLVRAGEFARRITQRQRKLTRVKVGARQHRQPARDG